MNTRQRFMAVALVLTLLATAWTAYQARNEAPDHVTVAAPATSHTTTVSTLDPAPPTPFQIRTTRIVVDHDIQNMFAVTRWTVTPTVTQGVTPAPPPPPPLRPPLALPVILPPPEPPPLLPPPMAPPFPYQYLGRLQEGTAPWRVFLLKGNIVYTVHEGDVLDGTYRVQKIAARQLTLIYLPLQQEQSIAIGGVS